MAELVKARQARTGRDRACQKRGVDDMPRGGFRPGAGRPTLFEGKTERKTYSLTEDAVTRIERLVQKLQAENPDIEHISASDAVEYAIEYVNNEIQLPRRMRRRA